MARIRLNASGNGLNLSTLVSDGDDTFTDEEGEESVELNWSEDPVEFARSLRRMADFIDARPGADFDLSDQ